MTDRPIPFKPPLVRAILEGRKTQTRRIVRPLFLPRVNPEFSALRAWKEGKHWVIYGSEPATEPFKALYAVGDRLWVRERTLVEVVESMPEIGVRYVADGDRAFVPWPVDRMRQIPIPGKCLSMGCHREASRLTLIVTDVKVERLRDISEEDAAAEGVFSWRDSWTKKQSAEYFLRGTEAAAATRNGGVAQRLFYLLWQSINGPGSWDAAPWVGAVTFETHQCNIAKHGGK